MTRTVYLAGPITACDHREANDWRSVMQGRLEAHGITGISPLRCEPLVGDRYDTSHPDPRFGTWEAIASKNFLDVQLCDMTVAYFPADLTERDGISSGTLAELAWGFALRKPTLRVSTHPKVTKHPVITACSSWKLSTLDEALDVIVGVLGDYAKGVS